MKFILFSISLFLSLNASQIRWIHDYEAALKIAQKYNKKIVLLVVESNCKYCEKLKSQVYSDDEVIERVFNDFVPLMLNQSYHKIPKKFISNVVPVTRFINYDGSSDFKPIVGASYNAEQLINLSELTFI